MKINQKGVDYAKSQIQNGNVNRKDSYTWSQEIDEDLKAYANGDMDVYSQFFLVINEEGNENDSETYMYATAKIVDGAPKVFVDAIEDAKNQSQDIGFDELSEVTEELLDEAGNTDGDGHDSDDVDEGVSSVEGAQNAPTVEDMDPPTQGDPFGPGDGDKGDGPVLGDEGTLALPKELIEQRNEKRKATYTLVRSDDIDWSDRTIELTFSSEEPVRRGYGYEVLSHSESAKVDLSRFDAKAGPLLLDHDDTKQIGVVERAWIDRRSKRGKAVVRFSRSELASEVLQDVKDGIRRNISFGYSTMGSEPYEERQIEGVPAYRFDRWQGFEISIVSIPADATVGIARNLETETKNTETHIEVKQMSEQNKTPEVNVEGVRKQELERINMIRSLGEMAGFETEARKFIERGDSAESFRNFLQEKADEAQARVSQASANAGMTDKDVRNYSPFRALQAQLSGNWDKAGLEREISRQVELNTGRSATGFYVPGEYFQRATVTTAGDGGEFVQTVGTGGYIDALKSESVIMPISTVYEGLVADLKIPVLLTQADTQYDAEDSAIAEDTAQNWSNLTLSPNQAAIWRPVSRVTLAQAIPSVERAMMEDFVSSIALSMDSQALIGTGTNAPTGILNDTNITQSGVLAGTTATYAELVDMLGDVIQGHNDNATFVFNPAHYANLLGTPRTATYGDVMAITNNSVAGKPVVATNGLTAGYSICGKFKYMHFGLFGGMDVFADPYTEANSGNVIIRAFQMYDAGVSQPGAFAWRQDSSI